MMILKRIGFIFMGLSLCLLLGSQCRSPATTHALVLPADYQSHSAEKKSSLLYSHFERTKHETLPPLQKVDVIKFISAHLNAKMDLDSDEAPVDYEKSIHVRAATALVSFEAAANPYTGLFQGAPYGVLRLSVTSDPKGKDFAPGLALKFLVDGQPSRNLSALFKLSGQGANHNFFANELSNIIPIQIDPKSLFSQAIFSRVTSNATKVAINPFAEVKASGERIHVPHSPVQIYFVPNHSLDAKETEHDFREDLLNIPEGTVLYEIFATQETGSDFLHIAEQRRAKAVRIGRLVSRSKFITSEFGDSRLFFRHYRYEDSNSH